MPKPAVTKMPKLFALKAQAPLRIATVAQDVGVNGAMALILLLVAFVLAGAIPLTHVVRRLRVRRG
jgi:hypothetical protein